MQLMVDSCSQDWSGGQSLANTNREWKLYDCDAEKHFPSDIISAASACLFPGGSKQSARPKHHT